MRCRPQFGVLLVVGVLTCGCAPGSSRPETVAVTGLVTYQGQPVAGAEVSFLPKSAGEVRPAKGTTDTQGEYRLTTYFAPDDQPAGAIPGDYTVTIHKIDLPMGIVSPENYTPPKNHLPAKYDAPNTSGLAAQVKAGAKNEFPFALVD